MLVCFLPKALLAKCSFRFKAVKIKVSGSSCRTQRLMDELFTLPLLLVLARMHSAWYKVAQMCCVSSIIVYFKHVAAVQTPEQCKRRKAGGKETVSQ